MSVDLNELRIKTDIGTWITEYLGEPMKRGSDRIEYHIRFKWINPLDPEDKETPERRLRLTIYDSHNAYSDFERKLHHAILMWLESDEMSALYRYPSILLEPPADHAGASGASAEPSPAQEF